MSSDILLSAMKGYNPKPAIIGCAVGAAAIWGFTYYSVQNMIRKYDEKSKANLKIIEKNMKPVVARFKEGKMDESLEDLRARLRMEDKRFDHIFK